jgi:hypothetical protein
MGIEFIPRFRIETIDKQLEKFAKEHEELFINGLRAIGEEYVNTARLIHTYADQTGALRSSIGCRVIKDGVEVYLNVEGIATAKAVLIEASEKLGKGIWLIVCAGMNYALWVEKNSYDVLSGSRPTPSQIVEMFKGVINE